MRKLLSYAALAIALSFTTAQNVSAAEFTLKFAHEAPETAIKGRTANVFADLVAKYSDGEIQVNVFPGGQLLPTKEEIRAAVRGQVDFVAPFTSYYSSIDSEWDVFYQPFLFKSVDKAMEAFSGKLGETVLSKLDGHGLIGLGIWHDGPVYVFTKGEPLTGADGLKGKKIRVFPSKPLESMLQKLGASPVSMPATEVYLALQQGVVDGVLTTPTYAAPAKWHEVLKGMSRSMFGVGGYGVSISEKTWKKLNDKQRAAVRKAMAETVEWNRKQAMENIAKSEKALIAGGVSVVDPSEEVLSTWKTLAKEVYAEQSDAVQALIADVSKN